MRDPKFQGSELFDPRDAVQVSASPKSFRLRRILSRTRCAAARGPTDKQQQSAISIGSAQRIQNLVFPIAVVPDIGSIDVDGLPWRCLLHGLAPASVLAQRHYSLLF
ncbi:hypothetical protein J2W92_005938 [Rhizobium leguminosarum]